MKRFSSALLAVVLLHMLFGGNVSARVGGQLAEAGVKIHTVTAKDGEIEASTNSSALELTVTYSLLREGGQAVVGEKEVQDSELIFAGPPPLKTREELVKEETWNIVLVTDLSNTGPEQFKALLAARKILSEKLEGGPNANYAWYDFAETLVIPSRFEKFLPVKGGNSQDNDKDNLVKAIQASKSAKGKQVCLNAVIKDAISKVKGPAGKKAVLVLTHQGDTCSSATQVQAVIDAATQTSELSERVQIFAVGLGGPTLQAELDALTNPTGGAAFVKDLNAIGPAIEQTQNLMKGQREAVFLLYPPKAGDYDAALEVTTANGTKKTAPLKFSTKRAYIAPPSLVFDGAFSTGNDLQLHFKCVSPEQLEQVRIQLFKPNAPDPVHNESVPIASLEDKASKGRCIVKVPGDKLQQGVAHTLRGVIKLPGREPLAMFAEDKLPTVVFEPTPPKLKITGFTVPGPSSPQFAITLTSDLPSTLVDVSLIRSDQGGQAVVVRKREQVALALDPQTVTFTMGDLPNGFYVAQAEWTGKPEVNASSEAKEFAPESFGGWLTRIFNESATSRMGLIAIGVIALLGLIFVVGFMRSRSASPIKVVPDELTDKQRMRRIEINASPTSIGQPSALAPSPSSSSRPEANKPSLTTSQPARATNPTNATNLAKADPINPASGPTSAYIRVVKPANVNFKGRIKKTPFAIGRDNTNDGILPVDGQSGVSRKKHISLVFQNGQWHVRDEGTPNGTKLNGSRIAPNQLMPLGAQALLVLGQVEIEFQVEKQN